MRRFSGPSAFAPLGLCGLLLAGAAQAAPVDPQIARWSSSLAEFAAADEATPPSQGGVLFVGSSSIRLWPRMAQDFSEQPVVINRGFGGSTMADCHRLVRQLVIKYRPRQVLVYAGENDLAEGRAPADVLQSFRAFVAAVRAELPGARIAYISVKPSPLRAHLMEKVRETNRLLASHVAGMHNADFVDVFTPMLDATGAPRAELFGPDRLHMNQAGYALWRRTLARHLTAPSASAAASR
ncbi:GDSL family lipase [Ramlibacter rhizophilus]|uniref:GDSL family lipase n=1 Tax=Ramlibacter rhizophilus TaxID=1781167 RepID=A0A4Z0BHL9_9BURK|nr:GDSL family lipase [Ramlibacter rhizophilus]